MLEFAAAPPDERQGLREAREGWSAVMPAPPSEAVWSVPLGFATSSGLPEGPVFVETLRAQRGRSRQDRTRIWLDIEDDVPHIRDRLRRLADSVGLAPGQLAVAGAAVATAEVFASRDLLLCSSRQADELRLPWREIGNIHLLRGYAISTEDRDLAQKLAGPLAPEVGACLKSDPILPRKAEL
jgi:hypothetical protein